MAICSTAVGCGGEARGTRTGSDGTNRSDTNNANKATLVVAPDVVASGDSLEAAVENKGSQTLVYDPLYRLERMNRGTWQRIRLPPLAVPAVNLAATPGNRGNAFRVTVPDDLRPGLYRVTNEVRVRGREAARELQAEFRVR